MKTGRRGFLKTVAASAAAAQGRLRSAKSTERAAEYPRVYSGEQLGLISFPLGGIGAGSIGLGGRGQFIDWEIFNRAHKGSRPPYAFASIWAQMAGESPVAFVLESQIRPPYEGAFGLGSDNVPGLPRLAEARFTGEFPMARIDFTDPDLPVTVALEAFTPFIPLDVEASGLPSAILRYRVRNPRATKATVSIGFSLDNPVGRTGRMCVHRSAPGVQGLLFTNPFLSTNDPVSGSFVVGVLEAGDAKEVSYVRGWRGGTTWLVGPLLFWDAFSAHGNPGPEPAPRSTVGSLTMKRDIPAGGSADFTFVLAWRFPNRTPKRCGALAAEGYENSPIGNHYCTRFDSAWSAAEFTAQHLPGYEARTRNFLDAMRRTTLPGLVRDGAMSNLSTLVSPTCFQTSDGRFHGFEGCADDQGCCAGSCTHVWNYETATAFLFPSLARSLRENGFVFNTDAAGSMGYREMLPPGKQIFRYNAADGQMGQIMHLYLDWRMSGDTEWLRALWPDAKRAIEYAWVEGGWDQNRDGVMEGAQHNTYDVEFLGPNPLCGVWYLGALRAAEEMATVLGDEESAGVYRGLFKRGSAWIDANLFNGEYYVQKIQATRRDDVAEGALGDTGAPDTEHPDFQVGDGCLVDQLVGQYFAHLCGLGLLLEESHIRKTLESIYRLNYKKSLNRHNSVQRTFALNDEAGLVICDYGNTKRPEIPFPYFSEVMTGFEYSAAVLMMCHGMVNEGVECIGNIRRRYDGRRRNPWNEAECGSHYARAMASWSAIPALSGWTYHAVERSLSAQPRVNEKRFESFWSTGTGWGTFAQTLGPRNVFSLKVDEGGLVCRTIELSWGAAVKGVKLGDNVVPFHLENGRVMLTSDVAVLPGMTLTITG